MWQESIRADVVALRGVIRDEAQLRQNAVRLHELERRLTERELQEQKVVNAVVKAVVEDLLANEMRQVAQNAARRAALPALVFFF